MKNAGNAQYKVITFPGDGYTVSKEGQDLVPVAPSPGPDPPEPVPSGPEPSKSGFPVWAVLIVLVIVIGAVASVALSKSRRL